MSPDIVGAQNYMSKVFPTESLNLPRNMILKGEYIYISTINGIGTDYGTTIRKLDEHLNLITTIDMIDFVVGDESFYAKDDQFYAYGNNRVISNFNTFKAFDENLNEYNSVNYSTGTSNNYTAASILINDNIYTITEDIIEQYEDEILWFNKIDLEGNQIWTKKYGTQYTRNFASEMLETNDGYAIASISHVENSKIIGEILKMDENGNEIWKYTQDEPIATTGLGIQDQWISILEDGKILAATTADKHGDPIFIFNEWYKYPQKLTWLDQNGVFLKDTLILSPRYEEIYIAKLQKSNTGGFYGLGYWGGTTSIDRWNGWIFKMTNEGEMLWSRKYKHEGLGSGYSHYIYDLIELENGDIITVGSINGLGVQGLWMMKLNSDGCLSDGDCGVDVIATSTVELHDGSIQDAMVYPNPSNGLFNIDPEILKKIKSLELYDMQGAKLQAWSSQIPNSLDLSSYQTGVYVLKAQLESGEIRTMSLYLVN